MVSRLPLSPTVDAVISAALEKNPEHRFQNAKAFSRAMRQACDALILDADAGGATEINLAAIKMEPVTAAAVWDDTVLRTVERQLAHFVGPMARIMIRKAAQQTTDVDQLYTLLSDNIADPVKSHRQFLGRVIQEYEALAKIFQFVKMDARLSIYEQHRAIRRVPRPT